MPRLNRNETGAKLSATNVAVTASALKALDSNSQRVSAIVRNNGATDLFLGGPNVTIATGYPLRPDEEEEYSDYLGALYVVSGSTGDLRVQEIS